MEQIKANSVPCVKNKNEMIGKSLMEQIKANSVPCVKNKNEMVGKSLQ